MRRLTIISILLLSLAYMASAQEQLSVKQEADKLYERYEYFKSLKFYLKLVNNKTDVKVLERISDCYRNINQYDEAEKWYTKAIADVKASKISHYNYAEVLLRNRKFDEAKAQYQLYYINEHAALKFKLATCDSAALWMKQPSTYKIKNEEKFNTEYSDWGLTSDSKNNLIFTSDRTANNLVSIDNRTGNNWFKMYQFAAQVKELPIITGDIDIFNGDYHVGPMALNKTADTAFITVTTSVPSKKITTDKKETKRAQTLYTRRLLLVMATIRNNQWIVYGSFPFNDIQKYSVGNAALSDNGKIVYFSSDMPGGEGKTDIWYCEKKSDGSWNKPINCGKAINTKEEENFPTINNNILYYSSKGLAGMGGYDIYKALGEKADWQAPQNLKYPINSTCDDFYMVSNDGINGYFSSNREGGKGSDDIYSLITRNDSIPLTVIKKPTPLDSKPAMPAKTETGFVLNNIYYDLDKSNIRPDAAIELDKLVIILKRQPNLKISVSSYTDSRASVKYNLALSQRRAKSAVAYIIKHGIDANRLITNYYGKTYLVNNCGDGIICTETEHQLNRRTEFKAINN